MADIDLIIKIPDHLYKLLKDFPSDSNEGTIENVLMKAVENGTPLNEQEPKTGHWVELPTHESQSGLPWYECSECNSERCIAVLRDFKYCPNCGAKMVVQKERSEE